MNIRAFAFAVKAIAGVTSAGAGTLGDVSMFDGMLSMTTGRGGSALPSFLKNLDLEGKAGGARFEVNNDATKRDSAAAEGRGSAAAEGRGSTTTPPSEMGVEPRGCVATCSSG